ncbi:MAG: SprT family zinc-dependent metalloprotease [Sphaerochaeta sp.]|jgi:predicted metal-dependent hydrolase
MKTKGKVAQIPYTLTRRRTNKNIVVRVDEHGHVQVSAPPRSPRHVIEEVIKNHEKVLRSRIAQRKELLHTFATGDRFIYEGERLTLLVRVGSPSSVQQNDGLLVVTLSEAGLSPQAVEALLKKHYRKRTRERVMAMIPRWATALGLEVPPFTVRDAKRRWASCSSSGRLNFSLRCQSLDDEQLSYLVLHELAHLIHFDHSAAFHALLRDHMPAYKEIQKSIFAIQAESQLI